MLTMMTKLMAMVMILHGDDHDNDDVCNGHGNNCENVADDGDEFQEKCGYGHAYAYHCRYLFIVMFSQFSADFQKEFLTGRHARQRGKQLNETNRKTCKLEL